MPELRGFGHLEKIYRGGSGAEAWDVLELRPVEQWFWCRPGLYGAWRYNRTARQHDRGDEIDRRHWVVREIDDAADEIFARMHIHKRANDADWDGFLERYGIPSPFIEGPPNVPQGKEAEYQETAESIAADGGGYLPHGSKVHFASPPSGGSGVFRERLDYLDGQIVIAGTSGKLSILNEATGIGGGQAAVHEAVFDELAEATAMQVAGELQRQFDAPILARVFPGEPVLAYFDYSKSDTEDIGAHLANAKLARAAGFSMDAEELSERTGYQLSVAEEKTPVQNAAMPLQNDFQSPGGVSEGSESSEPPRANLRDSEIRDAAADLNAPISEVLAPVLAAVDAGADPAEIQRLLEVALDEWPALLEDDSLERLVNKIAEAVGGQIA
jgi:phage gp29-like protein